MGFGNIFPGLRRRPRRRGSFGDRIFHGLTLSVAIGVVGLLAVFVGLLLREAWPTISQYGIQILYNPLWAPVRPSGLPLSFGALPFVFGTLVTSALALVIGVPLSLGVAVFLSELSPTFLKMPLSVLVELLAAVPSVVYGLWGYFVLVPVMRTTIDPPLRSVLGWTGLFSGSILGTDYLTAAVILAIMIVPTVSAVSRETMAAVPDSQREAALSLGATRWETTRLGVIRYARVGIFGAIILGLGRAVGETMAVTMTIGNTDKVGSSLFSPGQTIASLIANEWGEAQGGAVYASALIELGLILLGISVAINVVARLMTRRVFHAEATSL
jgi:phosphate transport system permease protein